MTQKEELTYLVDLLKESSKWRLSENDERDPIRIEVEQRLDKLLGRNVDTVNGREQSVTMPSATVPAASTRKRKKAPSDYLIRVKVDGRFKRFPREMCDQVPCVHSTTGYKWVLKQPQPSENGIISKA